jgi:hypothetical protein
MSVCWKWRGIPERTYMPSSGAVSVSSVKAHQQKYDVNTNAQHAEVKLVLFSRVACEHTPLDSADKLRGWVCVVQLADEVAFRSAFEMKERGLVGDASGRTELL